MGARMLPPLFAGLSPNWTKTEKVQKASDPPPRFPPPALVTENVEVSIAQRI